ncbi:hypothetical protein HY488_03420 [Candidatus Woesearchaeota archaeon]|nr:hypothetical protein [Candidatus Woesearchaeota archaeon]
MSMKQKSIATLVVLLIVVAIVAGCDVIVRPSPQPEVEGVNETLVVPAEEQQPAQPQLVALPTGPGVTLIRQPTTKEGAAEKPVPFDKNLEWDMITLDSYTLQRTSQDKGVVEEITFTVRNMGAKKLTPRVILWFHMQETEYESEEEIVEKVYDLPALEPGYKVTKTYPMDQLFHYLEKEKTFTLKVRDRYVSPPKDLYTTTKTFTPIDEMAGQPISWT